VPHQHMLETKTAAGVNRRPYSTVWRVSRPPLHTDVNWLISPFGRNFAPPNENGRQGELGPMLLEFLRRDLPPLVVVQDRVRCRNRVARDLVQQAA
jgi:hypothetical protein